MTLYTAHTLGTEIAKEKDNNNTPFWRSTANTKAKTVIAPGTDVPLYAPNPYDRVVIGDTTLPGICDVSANPLIDYDPQKALGTTGANLVVHGYTPAKVIIMCKIYTPQQHQAFQGFIKKYIKLNAKETNAYTVIAPKLNEIGIHDLVVMGIETGKYSAVESSMTYMISCQHWVPSQKRPAKVVKHKPTEETNLKDLAKGPTNAPASKAPSKPPTKKQIRLRNVLP